jgi:hypothetical protein
MGRDEDNASKLNTYRWVFQILLGLGVLSVVSYALSLFPLNDDSANTAPLPTALTTFTSWCFAFPVFAIFLLVFLQFAEQCGSRMPKALFWLIIVVLVLALVGDWVYLTVRWAFRCHGAVDLFAYPECAYYANGVKTRWQFLWSYFSLLFVWLLILACAFILDQTLSLLRGSRYTPVPDADPGSGSYPVDPKEAVTARVPLLVLSAANPSDMLFGGLLRRKFPSMPVQIV